ASIGCYLSRMIDQLPVEKDGDIVTFYNTFQKIPFTYRLFHILCAPKIYCIFPAWIPAPPIDSPFVDRHQVPARLKYMAAALQFFRHRTADGKAVCPIS